MKIRYNKNILVFGIIILFIGSSVLPSISSHNNQTNIQAACKDPTAHPINDYYINSYWKFDECSGDVAHDSSGHSYDGTIHGATWVGGSGDCALEFDGVDDYVNFSDYSSEIMFNKTDDFIISFYFISTGKGVIYSAFAPWGFNPEFKIELVSNGSLLFRLIGASNLGITLYSTGTYNDDQYHYVEYYHNGISSSPTASLYVDDEYDNSATSYYYNIENDEYTKAKMGVNAHTSTDYFDGTIDDFKIIKYEQGNKQEPPTIDGPKVGKPNEELCYTFVTNDPEGDDIEMIYIDWDKGTIEELIGPFESGEEVTACIQYEEEGSYCIKAKSQDFWHDSAWSECYEVLISNTIPEPAICCSGSINLLDVKPEAQLTGNFEVTNCGEAESYLNWAVSEYPDWGTGWEFTPESGTGLTPEEGSIEVYVEFIAPPDKGAEFSGVIKVENTDDPSDFCEIPVSITTPRNKIQNNKSLFLERVLDRFPMLERLPAFLTLRYVYI